MEIRIIEVLLCVYIYKYIYIYIYISLGTLVPNSRDRQGKLWLLNVFGKQPYNNMSFKYRP